MTVPKPKLAPEALETKLAERLAAARAARGMTLAELAEASGANVHLGVRDGLDVVLIDTLRPRSALILSRMDVGSRMQIATSAAGRAYLCALDAGPQAALLADIRRASGKRWGEVEPRL